MMQKGSLAGMDAITAHDMLGWLAAFVGADHTGAQTAYAVGRSSWLPVQI